MCASSTCSTPTRRRASHAPHRCRSAPAPTPGCATRPIPTGCTATIRGRRRSPPRLRREEQAVTASELQAIDCDVHPQVPGMQALHPYLDEHWRRSVQERGIDSLDTISYPPNAPFSGRPDFRDGNGRAGADAAALGRQVLDRWGAGVAILNCLYGVQAVFNEDMAAAFAKAINSWLAKEWLDRDPRLRASIVVPLQNVELAVDEIERCAADKR